MWTWPMILIFNVFIEVVKVDVHAKFHQSYVHRFMSYGINRENDDAENSTAVTFVSPRPRAVINCGLSSS